MKLKKHRIDTVAFSFLGTLVDSLGGMRASLIEVTRGHRDVDLEVMAQTWNEALVARYGGPYSPWPVHLLHALRQACESVGVPAPRVSVDRVHDWVRRWPLHPDNSAMAAVGARYRCAIMTQLDRETLAQCLPNLARQPDYMATSNYSRRYKPDLGYFRLLRTQFDLAEPDHLVIISTDRETDLEPAEALGHQVIHVDRAGGGDGPHTLREAVALLG